ncbi:MAG: hypothetical protein ACE363_11630 [Alphaproteobacteria bacterium]
MSEMVLVLPVIGLTFAVGAGLVYILKGFMSQRAEISPVKETVEVVEHEEFRQAA